MHPPRRDGNTPVLRRRPGGGAFVATLAALLAGACAPIDTVAATAPTNSGSGATAPSTVPMQSGPPPITAPATHGDFLESPTAIPNGPGTADTLGFGTISPRELDALNELMAAGIVEEEPEAGDAASSLHAEGSTLVAHAIGPQVEARSAPSPTAPVISTHQHPTARGVPLVFQVEKGPTDGWVEVRLPVRPNGTTGWVAAEQLELTRNRFRLDLDVTRHELTLFRDGEELIRTKVALGNGATPTPIGEFYLTELLRPPDPNGVYGPYAYGLSGFSETLSSFNGGPGIIGIHGTNRPDLLGTDVSHGCIRVDNDVISEMATFLPLGTPVAIHNDLIGHSVSPQGPGRQH